MTRTQTAAKPAGIIHYLVRYQTHLTRFPLPTSPKRNFQMILSIESSCDDSAIAVTRISDYRLLYHRKISQEAEHSRYGGVVPELASRLHAAALPDLLDGVKEYMHKLKAVAITTQPGLAVTLNEGLMMAKTIAAFQNIPLIPVHHLKGHIYSLFIEKQTRFPMLVILISGGHTIVVRAKEIDDMQILATSMDDSVGEAFDKTAKMMGLGYPGGPIIEELATNGDEERFDLPVPLRNSPLIAFSLSGLKNAVRLTVEKLGGIEKMTLQDKCDLSASFQKAVLSHLIQKTGKILQKESAANVSLVGGASANLYLRSGIEKLCARYNKQLFVAPLEYCADNAAMIGRYGADAYHKGLISDPHTVTIIPSRKLQNGSQL
jgi:N6-L-threonylcarbamoyladenine synthase